MTYISIIFHRKENIRSLLLFISINRGSKRRQYTAYSISVFIMIKSSPQYIFFLFINISSTNISLLPSIFCPADKGIFIKEIKSGVTLIIFISSHLSESLSNCMPVRSGLPLSNRLQKVRHLSRLNTVGYVQQAQLFLHFS